MEISTHLYLQTVYESCTVNDSLFNKNAPSLYTEILLLN